MNTGIMKKNCRKENKDLYTSVKPTRASWIFIAIIFFSVMINPAAATTLKCDTIPAPVNLIELQGRVNKINNSASLSALKNKVRKANAGLTVIKVLHIGDSHLKAGFFSETFIERMNGWYGQTLHENIFFSVQTFCKTGTKYSDYAELAELDQQLISAKPDLVIISLGTNDAFSGSSRTKFYDKVHHLVTKIKMLSPASVLLLTTPADALKKNKITGRYESLTDLQYVVSVIVQYANEHHLAYWNLHQVMGGNYSINTWVIKKLASPDRIHFTQKGYTLMGEWLFEAFKKCL
jgi:lysophospholipase L1-like esterase